MKKGDLVTIYYVDHRGKKKSTVDETGIILQTFGHKAEVMLYNKIETWDISDLAKMKEYKNADK